MTSTGASVSTSNVEPLFTPTAPCAKNPKVWARLEQELEEVISYRASKARKTEASEPLVRQFCAHCPIRQECYDIAAASNDFTGIAGGALFHEGEVSMWFDTLLAASSA